MEEFNHLLHQATLLKTEQLAVDRRLFDSFPEWYRHSMFASEKVKLERSVTAGGERIRAAVAYKESGNQMMAAGDFNLALVYYGNALSLFRWIENVDSNWKKKAINDKDIVERRWAATDSKDREDADAVVLACLLNLALLYQKMQRWADAARAAEAAIEHHPGCAKAYFRKAQALSIPLSSGTTEYLLALRALRQAVQLDPDNRDIRNAYDKLQKDVTIQQEKDKLRFKGFLLVNRGHDGRLSSADDTLNIPHQQPSMSVAEAYTQLQDMESAAARHYDSGLLAESAELRETVNRIRGEIDQYVHSQKKSRAGSRCSQVSQSSDEIRAEKEKARVVATGFVEDLDFLEIKAMLRAREGCVSRLIPLPDHDAGLGLIGSIKYCVRRCAYELRTRFVIFELGIDWVQKICPRSWRVISAIEEEIFKDRLQNLFANDLFELKMNGLNDAKNNSSSSTMLAQLMEKYESRSNNAGGSLLSRWIIWIAIVCSILLMKPMISSLISRLFSF